MSDSPGVREKLQKCSVCICSCGVFLLIVVGLMVLFAYAPPVFGIIAFFLLFGLCCCVPISYVFYSDFQRAIKRRLCCLCTICCSEDVPSQETSLVECPPPVQRDEQTAVTIELEEDGGPKATSPPDKPETQGDLTTGAPPSYQVHIQPRWL